MGDAGYKVFISYSHADEKWGAWLQRSLEGFRTPKPLIGRMTPKGPAPPRIAPVFRDRQDLPAAGSLSDAINRAIDASEFLIVICSPSAAQSRYVAMEITRFKLRHGATNVLALIVDGEPNASDAGAECFPAPLRFGVSPEGVLSDFPEEPIAADARSYGDGKRFALLKIAAGILGVGLDDLVRRDDARRRQAAISIAAASAAGVVVMGTLTLLAQRNADRAAFHKSQAEGLIDFMLKDLREELTKAGALGALDGTASQVLAYYEAQKTGGLSDAALGRRARALIMSGRTAQRRRATDEARRAFALAAETTALLLERAPNDPQRIFDHAQSVFYVGDLAAESGDDETGEKGISEYLALAERLVAVDPRNSVWQLELAYATSNLASLRHFEGAFDEAHALWERSTEIRRSLVDADPAAGQPKLELAFVLSWQVLNSLHAGRFERARQLSLEELAIYEGLGAAEGDDFTALHNMANCVRRYADTLAYLGDKDGARAARARVRALNERLRRRESSEAYWTMVQILLENAETRDEIRTSAADLIDRADQTIALAKPLFEKDPSNLFNRAAYAVALSNRLDAGVNKAATTAAALATLLDDPASRRPDIRVMAVYGDARESLARYYFAADAPERARAELDDAIRTLAPLQGVSSFRSRFALARIYVAAGDRGRARAIFQELDRTGIRDDDYLNWRNRVMVAAVE